MTSTDIAAARRVFWIYAVVTGLAGGVLLAWGPALFRLNPHATSVPYTEFAVVRLWGATLIGAAAAAIGLAGASEIGALQRSLRWFGFSHGIVAIVLAVEQDSILQSRWVTYAIGLAVAQFVFLMYAADAFTPRPGAARRRPANAALDAPSRYDQAIREAAGQEERHRLARELHDSIKQQIFAIQTAAAAAETRLTGDSAGAREALTHVRSSAREAMTEMEVMLDQLRAAPIDNAGLVEALRKLCDATGFRTGVAVACAIGDLPPEGDVGPAIRPAILRIAQEALANVARHARAKHVRVELQSSAATWILTVDDDGAGFEAAAPQAGMGLRNMRSRADDIGATLTVTSQPGAGTSILLSAPLAAPPTPVAKGWQPWNNDVVPWAVAGLVLALWPGRWWVDVLVGILLVAALVKAVVQAFGTRGAR